MAEQNNPVPDAFAGGTLSNTTQTVIYTTPLNMRIKFDTIILVNTDVAARTFNLWLKRFGASTYQRIAPKDYSLAAAAMYESGPFSLSGGDVLAGDASAASVVDFTLNGMRYST